MKFKKNHKISFLILSIVVSFFVVVTQISAAEISFSVNTKIPDNQIDKSKTYFNLKMKSNQEQDVTVTLKNETKKDITINIGINSAKTNKNGVIEYGKSTIKKDESLKYPLDSLMTGPSSVVVPASSSKDITFHIKVPSKSFKGIVLGGLTFQQKSSEVLQDSSKRNTTVQNEYAYAVAVLLKESDDVVFPNLNLLKVKAGQDNYRNVINTTIQNTHAAILSDVKVDAKVYSKNGADPVYSSVKNKIQIAPNTLWQYPISLNGTAMQSGKYRLHMQVTGISDKKSKTWTFDKNFEITSTEAKALNKTDVDLKANTNNTSWVLFMMLSIIIILVAIILIGGTIWYRKKIKNGSNMNNTDKNK